MAKSVVAFELRADGNQAEGSVKSLKAQLREAQQDVQKLSDKFGATSEEAVKAARKAAELKDAIGDAKALTDAFNPDAKFKAFGAALQGVAGGFAAVQGAQALFGSQSEELEKTLLKVQGAMALTQGLNALGEAGDAFKLLGSKAVQAFNTIKAAIGSSGIGLLVIALGTIVAYWDDIKGAVSGVTEEQKKLNKASEDNLKIQQSKLKSIDSQENILKLQGKSERDILKLKITQTREVINAGIANLKNTIATTKAQIQAEQRNKSILQGILEFMTAPVSLLLKTIDMAGKAFGKNFGLEESFYGTIAKFVFDPAKVKADGEAAIAEQAKSLTELINQQAGFVRQIQDIDSKAATASSKTSSNTTNKQISDAKELRDAKNKTYLDSIKDENFRAQEELRIKFETMQEDLKNSDKSEKLKKDLKIEYEKQYGFELEKLLAQQTDATQKAAQEQINKNAEASNQKRKKAFEDNQKALADEAKADLERANNQDLSFEERLQAVQERENSINSIVFESEAAKTEFEKQNAEARIKIAEDEAASKVAATKAIGDAMGQLSEIIGKETAVGKGLAIAQATINTWLGATEVLRAKTTLPEPIGTISKIVNVAAIVASGIKSVKSIIGTKVPGGGGGGGNTPSMPQLNAPLTPQVQTTNLNQGQINQLASATSRAFVLESDVSGSQERIRRINRAARIN